MRGASIGTTCQGRSTDHLHAHIALSRQPRCGVPKCLVQRVPRCGALLGSHRETSSRRIHYTAQQMCGSMEGAVSSGPFAFIFQNLARKTSLEWSKRVRQNRACTKPVVKKQHNRANALITSTIQTLLPTVVALWVISGLLVIRPKSLNAAASPPLHMLEDATLRTALRQLQFERIQLTVAYVTHD
jgi:hypothetical protein